MFGRLDRVCFEGDAPFGLETSWYFHCTACFWTARQKQTALWSLCCHRRELPTHQQDITIGVQVWQFEEFSDFAFYCETRGLFC